MSPALPSEQALPPDGLGTATSPAPPTAWRRVGGNVVLLAAAVALGRTSTLLVFSVVAHKLGVEALGIFGVVAAYTAYWFFLCDLGLSERLVRDAAADPASLRDDFRASFNLKIIFLAAPVAVVTVALVGWGDRPTVQLFCLLTGAMSTQSLAYVFECAARARELNKVEALSAAGQSVVTLSLAVALLSSGMGVVAVGYAALAAALVRLALSAALTYRWLGLSPGWGWHPQLLRRAVPYLATTLMLTAYLGIDVAIIGLVTDPALVGGYIAISRLLLAFGFLVNYVNNAALPAAVRMFGTSRDRFLRLAHELTIVALLVGGLLAAVLAGLAEPILVLLYGDELAGAADLFRLSTLYLPLVLASASLGLLLTAAGRQADRARATFVGLVATVALCLALVPTFGSSGAVIQFLVSELVLLIVLLRQMQRLGRDGWRFRRLTFSVVSIGLAGAVFAALEADDRVVPATVIAVVVVLGAAYQQQSRLGFSASSIKADARGSR